MVEAEVVLAHHLENLLLLVNLAEHQYHLIYPTTTKIVVIVVVVISFKIIRILSPEPI